jgi:hypothetical protein
MVMGATSGVAGPLSGAVDHDDEGHMPCQMQQTRLQVCRIKDWPGGIMLAGATAPDISPLD